MRCPVCGMDGKDGAKFCVNCGRPLPVAAQSDALRCALCGTPNRPDASFCMQCGARRRPAAGAADGSEQGAADGPGQGAADGLGQGAQALVELAKRLQRGATMDAPAVQGEFVVKMPAAQADAFSQIIERLVRGRS